MRSVLLALLAACPGIAQAQSLTLTGFAGTSSPPPTTVQYLSLPANLPRPTIGSPGLPNNDYVTVERFIPGPTGIIYGLGTATLSVGEIVRSAADLSSQNTSGQVASLSQSLVAIGEQLSRVRRSYDQLSEGIALASAMTILPPPEGRRLAITASGGGYGSQGAGSISVSYRAADDLVLFGAYARSATQNAFKGGASWSPW